MKSILNKTILPLILFLCLGSSMSVIAQPINKLVCDISKRNPCTSKDLEVLDAFVEGVDQCFSCTNGDSVTRKLYMTIVNKTGSVRQAFSLYGTLNGGRIIGQTGPKVFFCVGPIDPKDTLTAEAGTIKFKCGDRLTLTDNFLAWVDASGTTTERCADFAAATKCSDIAPKCGTAAEIIIRTPLGATTATATEPCDGATSGGSIKVTVTGGVAPYSVVISKKGTGDCPATAPSSSDASYVTTLTVNSDGGDATTNTTLAEGDYCIYVTDANSIPCTYKTTHTIAGIPCCTNPAKPTVCEVPQSNLCPDATNGVTIKVSNLQTNAYYIVSQGTSPNYAYRDTQQATVGVTELTFTGLISGQAPIIFGEDRTSEPYCRSDTAECADITPCAPPANGVTTREKVTNMDINLAEEEPNVIAAPNPFNDKIRFTLKSNVTGQGSLELYNMLGQKVKTVFQGRVEKGKVQTIEYNVPGAQRADLIYLFRVGEQKTSGKLIGIQ